MGTFKQSFTYLQKINYIILYAINIQFREYINVLNRIIFVIFTDINTI